MSQIQEELIGRKFGRLTIVSIEKTGKNYKKKAVCECECGKKHKADLDQIKMGRTSSCGCLYKETRAKL